MNLKILVASLLNKDYNKRPTIFDFAKIPCIKKHIHKFISEHDCKEAVAAIIDIDKAKLAGEVADETRVVEEPDYIPTYQLEQLEEWAELIRHDIRVQDYKNGWFGKHLRCAQGGDIFTWIIEHVESNDKKSSAIC